MCDGIVVGDIRFAHSAIAAIGHANAIRIYLCS